MRSLRGNTGNTPTTNTTNTNTSNTPAKKGDESSPSPPHPEKDDKQRLNPPRSPTRQSTRKRSASIDTITATTTISTAVKTARNATAVDVKDVKDASTLTSPTAAGPSSVNSTNSTNAVPKLDIKNDPESTTKLSQILTNQFDLELYLKRQEIQAIKDEIDFGEEMLQKLYFVLLNGPTYVPPQPPPDRTPTTSPILTKSTKGRKPASASQQQQQQQQPIPPASSTTSSTISTPASSAPSSPLIAAMTGTSSNASATRAGGSKTRRVASVKNENLDILYARRDDGMFVRITCPECGRDKFSSIQGLINHSRIAHKLDIPSHDSAVQLYGEVVDESEVPPTHPCRRKPPKASSYGKSKPWELEGMDSSNSGSPSRQPIQQPTGASMDTVAYQLRQSLAKLRKPGIKVYEQSNIDLDDISTSTSTSSSTVVSGAASPVVFTASRPASPFELAMTDTGQMFRRQVAGKSSLRPTHSDNEDEEDGKEKEKEEEEDDTSSTMSSVISGVDDKKDQQPPPPPPPTGGSGNNNGNTNTMDWQPDSQSPNQQPPSTQQPQDQPRSTRSGRRRSLHHPQTDTYQIESFTTTTPHQPGAVITVQDPTFRPTVFEPSQGSRFYMKRQIVIGNISMYLPPNKRDPNMEKFEYRWMIYVRGPPGNEDISPFVKKVRFFLHASYRPFDVIDILNPPFRLSKLGWGEFPVKVQIWFSDSVRNPKPAEFVHVVRLDPIRTGKQMFGHEQGFVIELDRNTVFGESRVVVGSESDVGKSVEKEKVGKMQVDEVVVKTEEKVEEKVEVLEPESTPQQQPQPQPQQEESNQQPTHLDTLLRRIIHKFPLISYGPLHDPTITYSVARTLKELLSWDRTRLKSIEWHRAHLVRKCVEEEIGKGGKVGERVGTRWVVEWCRENGFTPGFGEGKIENVEGEKTEENDGVDGNEDHKDEEEEGNEEEEEEDTKPKMTFCRHCGVEQYPSPTDTPTVLTPTLAAQPASTSSSNGPRRTASAAALAKLKEEPVDDTSSSTTTTVPKKCQYRPRAKLVTTKGNVRSLTPFDEFLGSMKRKLGRERKQQKKQNDIDNPQVLGTIPQDKGDVEWVKDTVEALHGEDVVADEEVTYPLMVELVRCFAKRLVEGSCEVFGKEKGGCYKGMEMMVPVEEEDKMDVDHDETDTKDKVTIRPRERVLTPIHVYKAVLNEPALFGFLSNISMGVLDSR